VWSDATTAGDTTSIAAQGLIFESLYQYKYLADEYELEPCLAEEMGTFSEDGLTYTVHLKTGVVFQDDPCFMATAGKGRQVTAEDFIFALKRIADVRNLSTGWWLFEGRIVGLDNFRKGGRPMDKEVEGEEPPPVDYTQPVEGLKALDSHTLQIQLTQPYPQLEFVLAMPYSVPVAKEAVDYYNVEIQNHPIGTGPYRLEAWHRGLKVIFAKNPTFREELFPAPPPGVEVEKDVLASVGKRLPLMPRIELITYLESQPMWLNFLNGNLDVSGIPKDNFDAAVQLGKNLQPELEAKGIKLHITPTMTVFFMIFNMEDELLGQNQKLRQAISMVVDAPRRIEVFLNNRGMLATHILPPSVPGHMEDYENPYTGPNIERAKALLAEAGYPNGEGLPTLAYETTGGDPTTRQMAELFVNEMNSIGIEVKISTNTWPQYLEKLKTKRFQLGSSGWHADYPDAENFLQLLYGPNEAPGPNSCNYKNPKYNELYEKMSIMEDSPERREIIKQMVEIANEDCPIVYLFYQTAYGLTHKWYKNYRYRQVGQGFLKYRDIDAELREETLKEF